jgi:hypothetical protein
MLLYRNGAARFGWRLLQFCHSEFPSQNPALAGVVSQFEI